MTWHVKTCPWHLTPLHIMKFHMSWNISRHVMPLHVMICQAMPCHAATFRLSDHNIWFIYDISFTITLNLKSRLHNKPHFDKFSWDSVWKKAHKFKWYWFADECQQDHHIFRVNAHLYSKHIFLAPLLQCLFTDNAWWASRPLCDQPLCRHRFAPLGTAWQPFG